MARMCDLPVRPRTKNPRRDLMEWGSLVGQKAPDLLNDIFLVSSVSALANVGSAKDFSLRGGGSWCAFPAVLPSS